MPIIETTEGVQDDIYLESVTSSAVSEEVVTNYDTKINQQLEEKTTDAVTRNSRQSSFVRVDVEGLQRLNYITGELLISQKRRTLYDDQVIELIDSENVTFRNYPQPLSANGAESSQCLWKTGRIKTYWYRCSS